MICWVLICFSNIKVPVPRIHPRPLQRIHMHHCRVQRCRYRIRPGELSSERVTCGSTSNLLLTMLLAPCRYADLGDIFSEIGDISVSAPASATSSRMGRQIPTPTSASSIAIPRPPSRRSETALGRGRVSPSTISRADSVGSLEFRTAGITYGSSRGPSPLTIGITDTIPLAVAFHEIVHAYFK